AVAATGQALSAAYTSLSTILPELPAKWTPLAVAASGGVTTGQINDYAIEFSREIDGVLGPKGWQVPFPSVSAINPRCPPHVQRMASCLLLSRVHGIIRQGNNTQKTVTQFQREYDSLLEKL